ncbi:hypothetical protein [Mesotoga prima]|uniref:hypothetical protein n=1 Tax=Mesotoga prima TaxID=1184387 RepID=UPI002FD8C72B
MRGVDRSINHMHNKDKIPSTDIGIIEKYDSLTDEFTVHLLKTNTKASLPVPAYMKGTITVPSQDITVQVQADAFGSGIPPANTYLGGTFSETVIYRFSNTDKSNCVGKYAIVSDPLRSPTILAVIEGV